MITSEFDLGQTNVALPEKWRLGSSMIIKMSENEMLKAQNSELLEKLQAITNEFAVVKSDAEIIK